MKKSLTRNNISLGNLIKSVILSIFSTLISILIFAFILNIFSLGSESISIVNQLIKIGSILLGCFVLHKNCKKCCLYSYILLPVLYTIFTFIIFSVLNNSFSLDITIFNDAFFGAITGIIYYLLIGRR